MEGNCMFYHAQAESKVNGRSVWRHMMSTPIGNIHIVQYEQGQPHWLEIKTFFFEENLEAAERKYKQIIHGITSGKM